MLHERYRSCGTAEGLNRLVPVAASPPGICVRLRRNPQFATNDAGLLFVGEVFDFVRRAVTRWEKGVQETGRVPFPTQQRPAGTTSPVIWHAFFLIEPPFDTVDVVDQAVEDLVGLRRVADLLVATRHRLVRGENRGSGLIPVFADFPEVTRLPLV